MQVKLPLSAPAASVLTVTQTGNTATYLLPQSAAQSHVDHFSKQSIIHSLLIEAETKEKKLKMRVRD